MKDVTDNSVEGIVFEQCYIRAAEIELEEDRPQFPWHGYSERDFAKFDKQLQKLIKRSMVLGFGDKIERLIKRHKDIYSGYYERPISVYCENGKYKLVCDGRHRVYAARCSGGMLPVNVVEWCLLRKVPDDVYESRNELTAWSFGKIKPMDLTQWKAKDEDL